VGGVFEKQFGRVFCTIYTINNMDKLYARGGLMTRKSFEKLADELVVDEHKVLVCEKYRDAVAALIEENAEEDGILYEKYLASRDYRWAVRVIQHHIDYPEEENWDELQFRTLVPRKAQSIRSVVSSFVGNTSCVGFSEGDDTSINASLRSDAGWRTRVVSRRRGSRKSRRTYLVKGASVEDEDDWLGGLHASLTTSGGNKRVSFNPVVKRRASVKKKVNNNSSICATSDADIKTRRSRKKSRNTTPPSQNRRSRSRRSTKMEAVERETTEMLKAVLDGVDKSRSSVVRSREIDGVDDERFMAPANKSVSFSPRRSVRRSRKTFSTASSPTSSATSTSSSFKNRSFQNRRTRQSVHESFMRQVASFTNVNTFSEDTIR